MFKRILFHWFRGVYDGDSRCDLSLHSPARLDLEIPEENGVGPLRLATVYPERKDGFFAILPAHVQQVITAGPTPLMG